MRAAVCINKKGYMNEENLFEGLSLREILSDPGLNQEFSNRFHEWEDRKNIIKNNMNKEKKESEELLADANKKYKQMGKEQNGCIFSNKLDCVCITAIIIILLIIFIVQVWE